MQEIMVVLIVGVGVALIGTLFFYHARLIYDRYLRSYDEEVLSYLREKGFEHHTTLSMYSEDWPRSPFKKPPAVQFSWVIIRINGMYVDWTRKDYKRIVGKRGSQFREFWMQVTTTYFERPQIVFHKGRVIRLPEEPVEYEYRNLD